MKLREKYIRGTEEQLKTLKAVCTAYKSSPFLTEQQKNNLINKIIKPFEVSR